MAAALIGWVSVCGAGLAGTGMAVDAPQAALGQVTQPPAPWSVSPEDKSHLLHLQTIDGRSLSVGLIEVTEQGVVHYELDGAEGHVPIDDVLVLTPTGDEPPPVSALPPGALSLYLADGGLLRGVLLAGDKAAPRVLSVDVGRGHLARISFNSLSGIRTTQTESAALEQSFQAQLAGRRPGRDTMIIAHEGKAVVVPGSLESLTAGGWTFRFGNRTRSAGLDEAYGFVLGAQLASPSALPAKVVLWNGNRFTARILSAIRGELRLDAGPLGKITLPWEMIRRIDLRSERVVYVSDLTPSRVEQHTLLGTSWPVQQDRTVTGGPIRLGGITHDKGLGVHAYTALSYDLGGAYERFSAVVGVDDAVAPNGSVVFRVKLDGKPIFDSSNRKQDNQKGARGSPPARSASEQTSGCLRGGGVPRAISVDVRGGRLLTLECDTADGLDLSDHGDWANAILIRARSEAAGKTPPARSAGKEAEEHPRGEGR